MDLQPWNRFFAEVSGRYQGRSAWLGESEKAAFAEFVASVDPADRVPLLLHAYERYRTSVGNDKTVKVRSLETDCQSVLISTILATKLQPTPDQAAAMLRHSFHTCGHGCDVQAPLLLAEKAFAGIPYSMDLFDAVAAYKETLRPAGGVSATNVKAQAGWILWHDVRSISKTCWSRNLQLGIQSLEPKEAFAWQWLLRNTSAAMTGSAGKAWMKEGTKRLAGVGADRFLTRLDEWFVFPASPSKMTPAGSNMLRLLVWYAQLADAERSLPILMRIARADWADKGPIGKVMNALAWILQQKHKPEYLPEIDRICTGWAGEISEVQRLELMYFPDRAAARVAAKREGADPRMSAVLETFSLFAAQLPQAAKFAEILKAAKRKPE